MGIYTFRDPQSDIWPKRPGKLWGLGRDSAGGPRMGIYHSDLRSAPRDGGRGQIIFLPQDISGEKLPSQCGVAFERVAPTSPQRAQIRGAGERPGCCGLAPLRELGVGIHLPRAIVEMQFHVLVICTNIRRAKALNIATCCCLNPEIYLKNETPERVALIGYGAFTTYTIHICEVYVYKSI